MEHKSASDLTLQLKQYELVAKHAEKIGLHPLRAKINKRIDSLFHFLSDETQKIKKQIVESKGAYSKKNKKEYKQDAKFYQSDRNAHVLLFDLLEYFTFSKDLVKIIHSYCCEIEPTQMELKKIYMSIKVDICESCLLNGKERYCNPNDEHNRKNCDFCFSLQAGFLIEYTDTDLQKIHQLTVICHDCLKLIGRTLHSCNKIACPDCRDNKRFNLQYLTPFEMYYDHTDVKTLETMLCPHTFRYHTTEEHYGALMICYDDPAGELKSHSLAHYKLTEICDKCNKWVPRCNVCETFRPIQYGQQKIIHDADVTVCYLCADNYYMSPELIKKHEVDIIVPGLWGLYHRMNPNICACTSY